MANIEALRARKRELLARKKCELDLYPELAPEGVRIPRVVLPRKRAECGKLSRIPVPHSNAGGRLCPGPPPA